MKPIITLVGLALALGTPLATLADEGSPPVSAATPAISTSAASTAMNGAEKINLVVVKSEKQSPLADFVMPKYLTIQQENDARQREYDALFNITPAFHSP